jgi:hypothetical protein
MIMPNAQVLAIRHLLQPNQHRNHVQPNLLQIMLGFMMEKVMGLNLLIQRFFKKFIIFINIFDMKGYFNLL